MSKEKQSNSRKPTEDDLPEILSVEDVEHSGSFLFYGLPNTGKTTLFSSFPRPALLLDIHDKGTDSIRTEKGISVAQIEEVSEIEAVFWGLKTGKLKDKKTGKQFKTVGIDTVTQLEQLLIEDITGFTGAMSWGSLTRRQFGDVTSAMKRIILDFRDLDMETVFLAQQRISQSDDDNGSDEDLTPEIGPAVMPSVARTLNADVGTIGQTFIRKKIIKKEKDGKTIKLEKMQHCLYIGPNPIRVTKIRNPKDQIPPDFLINPTYKDLIEVIEGE